MEIFEADCGEVKEQIAQKKNSSAQVLAQLQSISAALEGPVNIKSATIIKLNDTEVELRIKPTSDKVLVPLSLDTTTMGIATKLHVYHTGDYGLLASNICKRDS